MHAIHSIVVALACCGPADVPNSDDASVVIELFAENPLLVTPTGIAVDRHGRVFVAESHTHFRPDDYDGPAKDRILILEDTDGDGRADKRTIFHEGFTYLMDLEFDADGALFVATRMDIHRLRDTTGDGQANEIVPVVTMKTTGTYPHNGISGLCFNTDGSLNFGLGENLGHDYTLVGSDMIEISGGGEGGSTYHVQADGKKLRRVTTGWWNPFGMCVDSYGRIFGTDNDPGSSPPCRLIQIHEAADYGYEYRYGRTGLHPLISWTGDLPGNIPMIAGTGEAPCGIISTQATNLPTKYRRDLLVAAWADHQIERYEITQPVDQGQVNAQRHTLIQGGNEFRPVGLAVAPNGDIYVSDWVSSSYQLHGLGRVWKIRGENTPPVWEAKTPPEKLTVEELQTAARTDADIAVRVQSVRELLRRSNPQVAGVEWAADDQPVAVQALAVPHLRLERQGPAIFKAERSRDPVLRHAAIQSLASQTTSPEFVKTPIAPMLLAMKRSALRVEYRKAGIIEVALSRDGADEAREIAIKWVADDMLMSYRNHLAGGLQSTLLSVREYAMLSAAVARLDGKKPDDLPSPQQLAQTALRLENSIALRVAALRLSRSDSPFLTTSIVSGLLNEDAPDVRLEAIRLLTGRAEPDAFNQLLQIAADKAEPLAERLHAIAALAPVADSVRQKLTDLANDASDEIALASLQSLIGATLSDEEQVDVTRVVAAKPQLGDAVKRLIGVKFARPDDTDTDAWLKLLDSDGQAKGDANAGERIFFHSKVGSCSKCHEHGGRGTAVGPSLSLIARRLPPDSTQAKRWFLEANLQPSKDMAPQYTPWTITTKNGKQLTGLPLRKGGNSEAYLGIDGKEFSVNKPDIEFHQESRTSIMPVGLMQNLTLQELRDLFAFLMQNE